MLYSEHFKHQGAPLGHLPLFYRDSVLGDMVAPFYMLNFFNSNDGFLLVRETIP